MKIAITAIGPTGEMQPFLALSLELMRRGHTVDIGIDLGTPVSDRYESPFTYEGQVRELTLKIQVNACLDSRIFWVRAVCSDPCVSVMT